MTIFLVNVDIESTVPLEAEDFASFSTLFCLASAAITIAADIGLAIAHARESNHANFFICLASLKNLPPTGSILRGGGWVYFAAHVGRHTSPCRRQTEKFIEASGSPPRKVPRIFLQTHHTRYG